MLELLSSQNTEKREEKPKGRAVYNAITAAAATANTPMCKICDEGHYLCHCKEFGKWSPEKRSEYVKEHHLCFNCLSFGHSVFNCRQKSTCKLCGRRHHSLLHSFNKKEDSPNGEHSSLHTDTDNPEEEPEVNVLLANSHTVYPKCKRRFLATAVIPGKSSTGRVTVLRALVDPGSTASERATQMLGLKKLPLRTSATVTGVGCAKTTVSHVVQLEVLSRYEASFKLPVDALVIPTQLTTRLPCKEFKPKKWSHLEGLNLADPKYYTPGKIDMLLGIDVYTEILKPNLIKGPPGTPCAQDTTLGWILFGEIDDTHSVEESVVMHHHLDLDIHDMLKNMWDLDNSTKRKLTADERMCEEIYARTQSRTPDGRYVVKIPFKTDDTIQQQYTFLTTQS
ncbi:putative peptidase (DUF1758) domain-containing protein [Phthorimaea operculella]|nr:putative peptidase (DUF1758) domain-containing protein [Phthorimaea operculella]